MRYAKANAVSEDSTGWYMDLKIRRYLKSKKNPCADNRSRGTEKESESLF